MAIASELITEYCELPSALDLAAHGQRNAETAYDRLLEIRKANEALEQRRKEIAAGMDNDTLYALLAELFSRLHLNHYLLFKQNPKVERLFPIEVQAAFSVWQSRIALGYAQAAEDDETDYQAKFEQGKSAMGQDWRDGTVDAREWFRLVCGSQIKITEGEAAMLLRAWFDYVTAEDSLNENFEDRTTEDGSIDQKQLRKYYESFAIGNKVPAFMQANLDKRFANRWPEGKQLEDWQKIISVKAWGAFWKQFGDKYLAGRNEQAAATADIKKARESAGEVGAAERTRMRYMKFTQSFVQWLKKRDVTLDLIQDFPKQEDVSLLKGRDFLGVLFTAKQNPGTRGAMEEPLINSGIRLLQTDAEECFGILFRREIPDRKKK